jgi:ATP-dependent DNA helicase RecQ
MNICNSKPKDVSQLWKVDGISDEFIVKYGTEFINEINIVSKNKSSDKGSSGSKDITYKHYKDGKTMNEISELTGRKLRTIEDHMIYIFENYDDVVIDTDYFGLTEEFKSEINDAVKKVGFNYLKPIKDLVNNNITYAQIKLCLLVSGLK